MQALSIWQPWASLIAFGVKRVETRTWRTDYTGRIAIHATRKMPAEAKRWMVNDPHCQRAFAKRYARLVGPNQLPKMAIVAVATLSRCVEITEDHARQLERTNPAEFAFGNYDLSDGPRYAWVFDGVRCLDEPIECPGNESLWTPPADVVAQLLEHLPRLEEVRA